MVGKDLCTGCEACRSICPNNCIQMKYDEEGFGKPLVNLELCMHCGLCSQVCPVKDCVKEINEQKENRKCVVGYALDEKTRRNSSSGAVFPLLAEFFIKNGGIVYGAAYDQEYRVHHIEVSNIADLERIKGSKYVQSRIGAIYKRVKKQLDKNKMVLFSGTGCQIAGLKNYLKQDYENLYCVAIICHGVPSPGIWKCYKNQYREISSINFRDKTDGWKQMNLELTSKNGKKIIAGIEDPFYYAFLKNIILRRACYDCRFKEAQSQADIMIGDAWGVEYYARSFDDNKGTSLMITYTDKGNEMVEKIKPYMKWKQIENDLPYKYNQRILSSVAYNPKRTMFFKLTKYIPVTLVLKIFMLEGKLENRKG